MMSGYGLYIWPSYGALVLILSLNFYWARHHKKRTLKKLKHWFDRSNQ